MKSRELVVFYGMLFKKQSNRYYCNGAFGRYIDELASKFDKLYLVVPVLNVNYEDYINDYEIISPNIVIQELPDFNGYISALRKNKLIKSALKIYSQQWNSVVYIRWPVPFFKYVYNLASKKTLPVCFHIVGDTKVVVSEGTKYRGIIKILAVKFADYNSNAIKKFKKKYYLYLK